MSSNIHRTIFKLQICTCIDSNRYRTFPDYVGGRMQGLAVNVAADRSARCYDTLLSAATFSETVGLPNCIYCIVLIWGRWIFLSFLMNDLGPRDFQRPPLRFSARHHFYAFSQSKDLSEGSFLSLLSFL